MAKRTTEDAPNSAQLEPGIYKDVRLISIKDTTTDKGLQYLAFSFKAKEGIHTEPVWKPNKPTDQKLSEEDKVAKWNKSIDHNADICLTIAKRISERKFEIDYEYQEEHDWSKFCRDVMSMFPTNYNTVPLQIKVTANMYGKPKIQLSYFTESSIARMDAVVNDKPMELKWTRSELDDLVKYRELTSLQTEQTPVDAEVATTNAAGFLSKRKLKVEEEVSENGNGEVHPEAVEGEKKDEGDLPF